MNEILQSAIDEAKRNAESVHSGWSCTLLAYVEEVEAAALDAREMYKRGNTQIIIERERCREALAQTECLVASHEAVIDRLRAEHEIVKALVAGWEALPEGKDYPVDLIQAWLDKHIYPVVRAARERLASESIQSGNASTNMGIIDYMLRPITDGANLKRPSNSDGIQFQRTTAGGKA